MYESYSMTYNQIRFQNIFSYQGGPLVGKHDFVFFDGEYLKTTNCGIVKYNVIFEQKS